MSRCCSVLWLIIGLGSVAVRPSAAAVPATTPAGLGQQLNERLVATRAPGATWSVSVVALGSGKTLFSTNASRLLTPASDAKLFTAALALDRLGAGHRLQTSLRARGLPGADGVLSGDLLIVGGGDPSFGTRSEKGRPDQGLGPVVDALAAAGVKQVEGGLVCDESAFRGAPFGSGWNWDDLDAGYGASVSALSYDDNFLHVVVTPGKNAGVPPIVRVEPAFAARADVPWVTPVVDVRIGAVTAAPGAANRLEIRRLPGSRTIDVDGQVASDAGRSVTEVSVPSPADYFAAALRTALARRGIAVKGPTQVVGWRDRVARSSEVSTWRELASVPSPPVSALVRDTLKPSQNLHAQLLLLAVGAASERLATNGVPDRIRSGTTEEAGLRSLEAFMRSIGIEKGAATFEEGSGLSRKNLVTADAIVRLLVAMDRHRWAKEWREALPVGGVDGTLQDRFREPPTKGNVRAKTGSLRHVGALSGYVTTAAGERLAFSILVNGFVTEGAGSPRGEIDALVEILAAYAGTAG
jgi:D-alanyl-D-alanine carboxypeptidase/D-alanyl-D-alanine-endopeptidase (penicillin-binding protein 4)